MKAETFDGEEEVGWWTPDGRQTHVGPPQHWDRDQVLLLPGKVASLLLETVVNLLLETFGITLLDCAASLRYPETYAAYDGKLDWLWSKRGHLAR